MNSQRVHYWVQDLDARKQFCFADLLEAVQSHFGSSRQILVAGIWGMGLDVCRLDDDTTAHSSVPVSISDLLGIARDPDQFFEDIRCTDPASGLVFGIFDSTAMFVDGAKGLVEGVVRGFDKVTPREPSAQDGWLARFD